MTRPSSVFADKTADLPVSTGGEDARRRSFLAFARHRRAVQDRLVNARAVRSDADSVSWKINREVIVLLGWGRAILLQLAHPMIAAAVADHSSFRGSVTSGFTRLWATVRAMLAMTFGTDDEAVNAAARINCIHDYVSGRVGADTGPFKGSQQYSAHDPVLLRWVHATLLDSLPLIYERLAGGLTPEERDRYCGEAAIVEPLLDVPQGLLPRSAAQLDEYVAEMLAGPGIQVSDRGRALARAFLFPSGWRLLWPAFRPLQLFTIGLLPAGVRGAYGFEWRAQDARALERWSAALRLLRRVSPRVFREWPAARRRSK